MEWPEMERSPELQGLFYSERPDESARTEVLRVALTHLHAEAKKRAKVNVREFQQLLDSLVCVFKSWSKVHLQISA